MHPVLVAILGILCAKIAIQLWLERVNERHARLHAHNTATAISNIFDQSTYLRSLEYTVARSQFRQIDIAFEGLILALLLSSTILPALLHKWSWLMGDSVYTKAAFIFSVVAGLGFLNLPLDWFRQFRLEERFGFNTTTQPLWWWDILKGFVLSLLLGYPLLLLLLKVSDWAGQEWWFWAWGTFLTFQLLLVVLAPVFIMPLFNTFSPLPSGPLRERLEALARRTGFKARSIQIMDGSKRSLHSNAFFTGFGRFRRIVFFDTLISQLTELELEAVLAHEIGHYRRRHIVKMLICTSLAALAAFYILGWLVQQNWFFAAFGFSQPELATALLLFLLLHGLAVFWLNPLIHALSRRYEYQADAFAAQATGQSQALIEALRKLSRNNLSNLTPHPLYSWIYYSHPTLVEREAALRSLTPGP